MLVRANVSEVTSFRFFAQFHVLSSVSGPYPKEWDVLISAAARRKLKWLDLSECEILGVPRSIGALVDLTELDLSCMFIFPFNLTSSSEPHHRTSGYDDKLCQHQDSQSRRCACRIPLATDLIRESLQRNPELPVRVSKLGTSYAEWFAVFLCCVRRCSSLSR